MRKILSTIGATQAARDGAGSPARHAGTWLACCLLACALLPTAALPQTVSPAERGNNVHDGVDASPAPPRQSPDDAWWTGPMLANSAATLPRGHFLVEPYLYDTTAHGSDGWGSLTYMLYGLNDRVTVGLVPVLGYNRSADGSRSSGVGLGDASVLVQYKIVDFPAESSMPTVSLQLQRTLPTGAYDRLGDRAADGLGGGVAVTTLQVNTQTWFWLPNGRILRVRVNAGRSFAGSASVDGTSVYGTTAGFRGRVRAGHAFLVDTAWEYSLSRRWVLALDITYRRDQNTRVLGHDDGEPGRAPRPGAIRLDSGSREAFGFAPALEYSFSPRLGILFGTRVITGGHGTPTTITPAVAVNYVH